jgi:valyl-tRNA synthetase
MDKKYNSNKIEKKIYTFWEKKGYFKPDFSLKKEPWSCIMPPPNANAPLHVGHGVFISVEDILTRFNRMQQRPTLWLPGFDHAGFETQFVYQKKHSIDRKNPKKAYKNIWNYTQKNKKVARNQIKNLGASADWSKEKFTLDKDVVKTVYDTFKKLYADNLVYRGDKIINWCPKDRTSLSDLEVSYENRKGKLWYIKYPLQNSKKYIVVATTRPETMLGDTAVAVNPKDKRYKDLVGKIVILPLVNREIPIISDSAIDIKFGTGAVKVTPAHDPLDFEIAQKNKLEKINIISKENKIDLDDRFPKEIINKLHNLPIPEVREKILEMLEKEGFLEKEESYKNKISVCYKCKSPIEPIISKQWFIKIDSLASKAIKAIEKEQIKISPHYYKKIFLYWMKNIRDWNISRQIIWGIRIPVWYCDECGEVIVSENKVKQCKKCKSKKIIAETDVFDTWFSSGQWPFAVLGYPEKRDYKLFYPTSVMETGWDILFFWVARMVMLGIYVTGKEPFKDVVLHGLVRDKDRTKMSKSKGNVIDPLAMVSEYGADSLRMALIFGTSTGKDIIISEDKVRGQRNFANKIWNASRFVLLQLENKFNPKKVKPKYTKEDKWILEQLNTVKEKITKAIEDYKFHQAAEEIYHFFWHKFCDKTIEDCKKRIGSKDKIDADTAKLVLWKVLYDSLKMLHPFMPFITEHVYQQLPSKPKKALIIEEW